ncbi:MAG: c-type cytochrome [Candidatus Marinimicrobia bacterium]|jgi:cytochrome c2|nr:c-type cytochrome [Candidatus Neomarinimicrobiota bacterium]
MPDIQFRRVFSALKLDYFRNILRHKQCETVVSFIGPGLVFLVTVMFVSGNALAAPNVKVLLRTKSCGSCHIIPGVEDAYGKVGPTLKGLRERERIVAGTMENNTENLKAWLKDPKSIKSGTLMPNMGLTDEEIELVVEYLNKL